MLHSVICSAGPRPYAAARPAPPIPTVCGGDPLAPPAGRIARARAADFLAADGPPPPGVALARPGLQHRHEQLQAQQRALPRQRPGRGWRALADVLRLVFDSGIEAGCFFAANAIALTAQARAREGPLGAWTGWEPRQPDEPERYADGLKEAAIGAAVVAAPIALAMLLSRWVIQPTATALGQALLGPHACSPTPAEVFFPNPSYLRRDGCLRTPAELQLEWQTVREGRMAVVRRQQQFAHGHVRSLLCELAHPLAFALQGMALDFRLQRPGILTAGGISLGTAALAASLSDSGLHAMKKAARMKGVDRHGRAVDLHLFDPGHADGDSSFAERMRVVPAAIRQGIAAQLRAVTGGAAGAGETVLALLAELARSLLTVLALDGSAAPVDSLDAQFNRTPDQSRRAEVNLGFSLLSNAVAMLCFRLVSTWLGHQRDGRTGQRELARCMRQFRAGWMARHGGEAVALHDDLRRQLARGMAPATADRIVFEGWVVPMMKALRRRLAADPALYAFAAGLRPARLRAEMLADHAQADPGLRSTVYLDRLMRLPQEFPQAFLRGRARAPVPLQRDPESLGGHFQAWRCAAPSGHSGYSSGPRVPAAPARPFDSAPRSR